MFAPSGDRLAYTRTVGEGTGEIFIVNVGRDGRPEGSPRPLPYRTDQLRLPVWTHDGSEILLLAGSPTSNGGVARVRTDGDGGGTLIAGLEGAVSFALSRDGRQLVFARGGTDVDIWRLDVRTPEESQRIAPSTLWEGGPAYSPDGKRIAFSSNRAGSREIWVADASGDNAQQLTRFGGPVPGSVRWSPDSRLIAFDGRPGGNSDVFIVPADGGTLRQLTNTRGEDARPAWSPDGASLYFASDRSGRSEIWRMQADGSAATQITRNGGTVAVPSVDGAWLYYKRDASTGPIYAVRPDGS
jgi:Tol biopolymer transport system component